MRPEEILLLTAIHAVIDEEIRKERKPEFNLKGCRYKIKDNSYIKEIVDGKKMDYHCDLINQVMVIVSNPYITDVTTLGVGTRKQRMIKVKSMKTGFVYEVMFNEGWIL